METPKFHANTHPVHTSFCLNSVISIGLLLLRLTATAAQPVYDAGSSDWQFGGLGALLGYNGFEVAEINGETEIFLSSRHGEGGAVGDTTNSWHVLRWDPAQKAMRQVYASQGYERGLDLVRLLDVNGDGRSELMVARQDLLEFFNPITKAQFASINVPSSGFRQAEMVDIDQDGERELLMLTSESMLILGGLERFPEGEITVSTISGVGGYRFYVGQLDHDLPLEILFTWGGVIEVGSWKQEWQVARLNPSYIVRGLIDRDTDGISEMLVTTSNRLVTLDLRTEAEVWSSFVDAPLLDSSIQIQQMDDDPSLEFVIGEPGRLQGNAGLQEVLVADGATGTIEARYPLAPPVYDHGRRIPSFLKFVDIDRDGVNEMAFWDGDRVASDVPERLVFSRLDDQSIVWSSALRGSSDGTIKMGDLDGDGRVELVIGNFGHVTIVDPETSSPISQIPMKGYGLMDVKDMDGDGRSELLMGSRTGGELTIWTNKGGVFTQILTRSPKDAIHASPPEVSYIALGAADVDGDGIMEVIGGWTMETFPAGVRISAIEVYRLRDGSLVWSSPRQYAQLEAMTIGDFDGDREIEVAASFGGKWLRVWEPSTNREEFRLRGNFTSLASESNGFAAGTKAGQVCQFTARKGGGGYARTSIIRLTKSPISGIAYDAKGVGLWAIAKGRYHWLPNGKRKAFSIEGDRYQGNVAFYEGADGYRLFGIFGSVIRGFPLDL